MPPRRNQADKSGVEIFELWKEYERIAMHFNELLIKLRSQALAGVAVISALVSFLSKTEGADQFRWGVLAGTFFLLTLFWIAVWCLDFGYYNKLLLGAVHELKEIERQSITQGRTSSIQMSTTIEKAALGKLPMLVSAPWHKSGRHWFYVVVFTALIVAFVFSLWQHTCA